MTTPEELLLKLEQHSALIAAHVEQLRLEQIELRMRRAVNSAERMVEDAKRAIGNALKNADRGHYYRYLDADEAGAVIHPDILHFAHEALKLSVEELKLQELPLHLTWFAEPSRNDAQAIARMLWLEGRPQYFSEREGLRGWINWNTVLETNAIYINAHLGRTVMRTVAHECRHVWQRLQYGPEKPADREIEADAETYGDSVWDRLRWINL